MKTQDNTTAAFFALLRAGLFERPVSLSQYSPFDFAALYRLSEEQAVTGLILDGLLRSEDIRPSPEELKDFRESVEIIEERNMAMNYFIGIIMDKMKDAGIEAVLVKGQGIARCYAKPMWRAAGDIDFLLDGDNYQKAREFLTPFASSVAEEIVRARHIGMTIDPWDVELHGSLRGRISSRVNEVLDSVQEDIFRNGGGRVWDNDGTQVRLPSAGNDAFFIFAHLMDHFYRGGIGLRQICDWCQLLLTYRDDIDEDVLSRRLKEAGLPDEWHAFAAYAAEYLGMPSDAIPLYDEARKWKRKARRINAFLLEVGNFGHNRDDSFYSKYPYLVYKTISFWRHLADFCTHFMIFPRNSLNVFSYTLASGFKALGKGE